MNLLLDVVKLASMSLIVACIVRVAQVLARPDQKHPFKDDVVAIARYWLGCTGVLLLAAAVYWGVASRTYVAPNIPALADAERLPVQLAGPVTPPAAAELAPVDELRRRMVASVTPRAPPPIVPVTSRSR